MRAANYVKTLRRDLLKVAEACGVEHPGLIDADAVEILDGRTAAHPLRDVYGYRPGWGLPSAADRAAIVRADDRPRRTGRERPAVAHRRRLTPRRTVAPATAGVTASRDRTGPAG